MFWSEHGDRAQMITWAACLGVSRECLEAMGRWRTTVTSGYIRVTRHLVHKTQLLLSETVAQISMRHDPLGEVDLLDRLAAFMQSANIDAEAQREQLVRLRYFTPTEPTNDQGSLDCSRPSQFSGDEVTGETQEPAVKGPYVLSVSVRSRVRRLQRLGGC